MIKTGIWTGQTWTGRSGMGPTVKIEGICLDEGKVRLYNPGDRQYSYHKMDLTQFTQQYRLVSNG